MPLELRLRGKSTRQSRGTAIFYVDITLREGWSLEDTLAEAQRLDDWHQQTGFDQKALDRAAKAGFANGAFEDSAEESIDVVEEFYPDLPATTAAQTPEGQRGSHGQPVTLADKLQAKSQQQPQTNADAEAPTGEADTPQGSNAQQTSPRQAKRA